MLAKLKTQGVKSPDADVLLIEQARAVIRDSNPRTSVFYVTADRSNARSAVAILSPKNVLYINVPTCDPFSPRKACLAFWQPGGSLGRLKRVSLAELVWSLMLGTDRVAFENPFRRVEITYLKHGKGAPTDWVKPRFRLNVIEKSSVTISPTNQQVNGNDLGSSIVPQPTASDFLLPPREVSGPMISGSHRPSVKYMIEGFNRALQGYNLEEPSAKDQLAREAYRVMVSLGIIRNDGTPILESPILSAIRANDWDFVHAAFKKFQAYENALTLISSGEAHEMSRRQETQIVFARHLGQVARIGKGDPLRLGDNPVTRDALVSFLQEVLAIPGQDYSIIGVCDQALDNLGLTPARFEQAVTLLFGEGFDSVSAETGGTATNASAENIFKFVDGLVIEVEVSPESLYFGGDRPMRQLRRNK